MSSPRIGLIIVAAGASRRMEGLDKAFSELCGHSVIWYSLTVLGAAASSIVLVVRANQEQRAAQEFRGIHPEITVVPGGAERQDSVRFGLRALENVDVVAVHDAARPLAGIELLRAGLITLETCDGAIPALPVPDTIKRVTADGGVIETLDRSSLRLVQTPQLFWSSALIRAHEAAREQSRIYTDDACLLESEGYQVRCFTGSPQNLKITTRSDLEMARYLMSRHGQS